MVIKLRVEHIRDAYVFEYLCHTNHWRSGDPGKMNSEWLEHKAQAARGIGLRIHKVRRDFWGWIKWLRV
jgi:hypothetical protein